MKKYRVIVKFFDVVEVEATSESEATEKAIAVARGCMGDDSFDVEVDELDQ